MPITSHIGYGVRRAGYAAALCCAYMSLGMSGTSGHNAGSSGKADSRQY